MKSEANEMQRVPHSSLKLGMHTVMHRKEEGREERNSKAVFTSALCMQSSPVWHLPKCKGVFPSPSLWFGSAPWSRSSCTGNKETEPRQSLPFAPQVRPTRQPSGCLRDASVQLFSLLPETGDRGLRSNAEGPSTKAGSAAAPGLPEGKNWDYGHPFFCTSTALELGAPAPPPVRGHGTLWSRSSAGNFAIKHTENSNLCHVLNQNKEHFCHREVR